MSSAARQLIVVALLLAAVGGLFLAAESGQRQLVRASSRVELAAQREHALGEVLQVLSQAESGQRGYILLGNSAYLAPYQQALQSVTADLRRLDEAFAAADPRTRTDIAQIRQLSEAKFAEMSQTLVLYRTQGRGAAVALLRGDFGQITMLEIVDRVRQLQAAEADDMLQASRSWRSDRWLNLATMVGALAASLFLVLLLLRLVLRYVSSKEHEAERLAQRQAELERVVQRRTEDLSDLSTHLQSVAETERSALSRELHDELGGLLVAARMDVSWLEEQVAGSDADVQARFRRVQDALQAGVDLKRRVIENLRPSLLDNLGLLPALRWQIAESCERGGLNFAERYPGEELQLIPQASIAIFRIVQESLTNILKHAQARNVEVTLAKRDGALVITVRDDGVGLPVDPRQVLRSHGVAAMRHRAIALGGQCRITRLAPSGTQIEVRLPLERIEVPAAPRAQA
jgi:signal transduction histidine kinase